MAGPLNRKAYEELIAGDLEWLDRQPRTLEREHIRLVLEGSAESIYGGLPDDRTYAIRYAPGCPAPFEVRLVGGSAGIIHQDERDRVGTGATAVEAYRKAARGGGAFRLHDAGRQG